VAGYEAGVVGSSAGVQGFADGSIDPRFLIQKGPNFNCRDGGVPSVAMKLIPRFVSSRHWNWIVPVDVTQGVLKINISLVRPPIYVTRHYRLPCYPFLILRQQKNGGMFRFAKWRKRGSLVASLEWRIAVVESSFSPGSTQCADGSSV